MSHQRGMNERPVLGSTKAALNVGLWVEAAVWGWQPNRLTWAQVGLTVRPLDVCFREQQIRR